MNRDSKLDSWLSRIERDAGEAGRRLLLVGVSLVLTYILAMLTLMTRWMNFWIRGSYYVSYQAIFLTALMILLLLWLHHHNGAPTGLSTVMLSIAAGGVAGDEIIWEKMDRVREGLVCVLRHSRSAAMNRWARYR